MSTPQDRVARLFDVVAELESATEQAAYLDDACGQDYQLRAEVEELLAHDRAAGSFLNVSGQPSPQATLDDPIRERPGTVIGPYKLMEQIGEGGMGLVFVADQQRPVCRRVALKVIKPGMDTRQIVARFEAERQALALMDHPNIAKVYDGGTTDSGRPYFVMELVKGVPITEYCDQNQVPIRQRLELFVHVCQAVQHAHQKGIIHRDIKPSNVLLMSQDGTPVVKVIDFGVAKAIGQQLTDKTIYTQFTHMVGTPLYMSPEQAGQSGLDVDTRSDIYSLGVLLYELLTGTTPFDKEQLRTVGYDEMRRIIREEEPPKPSTRLSTLGQAAMTVSANRRCDPKQLSRLFRGELDWIVMKALEKDRNRRYETASAFGADVQRYLRDEPVQACPPSAWYRFRKFARRHRVPLGIAALGAVVLVLAVCGLSVGLIAVDREQAHTRAALEAEAGQHRLAEANFKLALDVLDEICLKEAERRVIFHRKENRQTTGNDFSKETAQLKKELEKEFVQKGLGFYERLIQQLPLDDPTNAQARLELVKAYRRVGIMRWFLGQYEASEAAYRRAIDILEQLTGDSEPQTEHRLELAELHFHLAKHLHGRHMDLPEAERLLRRSLALFEQVASEFPSRRCTLGMAHSSGFLGLILKMSGRFPEAAQASRRSLKLLASVLVESPGDTDIQAEVDSNRRFLADSYKRAGRLQECEAMLREQLADYRQRSTEDPAASSDREGLIRTLMELAELFVVAGRQQEALESQQEAVAVQAKLAADFPKNRRYQFSLARLRDVLGTYLLREHRFAEAAKAWQEAIVVWETLVPEATESDLLFTIDRYRALADLLLREKVWETADTGPPLADRKAAAQAALDRAYELQRKAIQLVSEQLAEGRAINEPNAQSTLAGLLATADPRLRDPSRAVELAKQAVRQDSLIASYWVTLGVAHYRAGNWADAIETLKKSNSLYNPRPSAEPAFYLAMAHWRRGEKDEARRWYESGRSWMEKHEPEDLDLRQLRDEAKELLKKN
jgi:serine/threonine protein kinase